MTRTVVERAAVAATAVDALTPALESLVIVVLRNEAAVLPPAAGTGREIALPGTPTWSYRGLTDEEAIVADGFAFDAYGAAADEPFVPCGIAFGVIPVRIDAPPRLVLVELARPD